MRILWYQSVCICGCLYYSPSSLYSKISPGWQFSSLQIASRVEKRMAFAFPVFNMERLAGVRSIFSAKSPSEIFRFAIITSKFTIIGIDQFILGLFGFSSTARHQRVWRCVSFLKAYRQKQVHPMLIDILTILLSNNGCNTRKINCRA